MNIQKNDGHIQKKNAHQVYQELFIKYSAEYSKEEQRYNLISNLRFLAFAGIVGGVLLLFFKYPIYGVLLLAASMIAFVCLIIRHEEVKHRKIRAGNLMKINQKSLERVEGRWVDFTDDGGEFRDEEHQYSIDLDIFGRASAFQWINNTFTYTGRQMLNNVLTIPYKDVNIIHERQKAITELADKLEWRQEFQAEGMSDNSRMHDPKHLLDWAEADSNVYTHKWVEWFIRLMPVLTIAFIILPFFTNYRLFLIAGILVLFQMGLFAKGFAGHLKAFDATIEHKEELGAFEKLFDIVEKEQFKSDLLKEQKAHLAGANGKSAAGRIRELSLIVDMMDFKNSAVFYFIFNMLFLWDYQCMISLEKWKMRSGKSLRIWLGAIGRLEELSSLAVVKYDNPDWAIPQFTDIRNTFSAKQLGHPLLSGDARVNNDLGLHGSGNVLLITGSNMSGKSTLLRTVGLSLVMAYSGAPVCAGAMKCSIMEIHTSMRVNDDLEKKISSFYAELKRVKSILDAVKKDNAALFLLDEIFRGTNTKDRHTGAKTVIKLFSRMGAVGLVSTHDLELGELEKDRELDIDNYHFIESYRDNKIIFDYKLRHGVSTTSNAIYLMKMIGIDDSNF